MASKSKRSTNTAPKSSSSHGREYLEKTAKMCPWPVNIDEKYISVPQGELEVAQEHLIVDHLRKSCGFYIQSAIGDVPKTNVFDPDIRLKQKPIERSEFNIGDSFEIKSTGERVAISFLQGDSIKFIYLNRNKPEITSKIEALRKVLRMEVWKRI